MKLTREDSGAASSRVVKFNGLAYYTDHVSTGKESTLHEQTTTLLARYDVLLEKAGLKKEDIVYFTAYFGDIGMCEEGFVPIFKAWCGENLPAGVMVQAKMLSDAYLVSLALTVAYNQ